MISFTFICASCGDFTSETTPTADSTAVVIDSTIVDEVKPPFDTVKVALIDTTKHK